MDRRDFIKGMAALAMAAKVVQMTGKVSQAWAASEPGQIP